MKKKIRCDASLPDLLLNAWYCSVLLLCDCVQVKPPRAVLVVCVPSVTALCHEHLLKLRSLLPLGLSQLLHRLTKLRGVIFHEILLSKNSSYAKGPEDIADADVLSLRKSAVTGGASVRHQRQLGNQQAHRFDLQLQRLNEKLCVTLYGHRNQRVETWRDLLNMIFFHDDLPLFGDTSYAKANGVSAPRLFSQIVLISQGADDFKYLRCAMPKVLSAGDIPVESAAIKRLPFDPEQRFYQRWIELGFDCEFWNFRDRVFDHCFEFSRSFLFFVHDAPLSTVRSSYSNGAGACSINADGLDGMRSYEPPRCGVYASHQPEGLR